MSVCDREVTQEEARCASFFKDSMERDYRLRINFCLSYSQLYPGLAVTYLVRAEQLMKECTLMLVMSDDEFMKSYMKK
jgi:hypothetical protein